MLSSPKILTDGFDAPFVMTHTKCQQLVVYNARPHNIHDVSDR